MGRSADQKYDRQQQRYAHGDAGEHHLPVMAPGAINARRAAHADDVGLELLRGGKRATERHSGALGGKREEIGTGRMTQYARHAAMLAPTW